jgi:DNA-binding NarL/FixJ family response regulator
MPVLDSDEAINACLHCDQDDCPGWCERVARKTQNLRPWPREAEFLELYRRGLNDLEICTAMGLAHSTVWHHRKRRGLPSNVNQHGLPTNVNRK